MPIYEPSKNNQNVVRLTCPHCGIQIVSKHPNPHAARMFALQELSDHIYAKHKEQLN